VPDDDSQPLKNLLHDCHGRKPPEKEAGQHDVTACVHQKVYERKKNYCCQGRSKVRLKHKMLTTPLASDIQIVLHHKARPSADLAFLLLNLNREKNIHCQAMAV
jgi:hypothetical protein